MISLLLVILFIFTLAYLGILMWLSRGLRRLENSNTKPQSALSGNSSKQQNGALPTVSLIVCARNEEQHLPRLLESLERQQYPHDKLEICLANDRSSDRTDELMENFAAQHPTAIPLRIDDAVPDFAPKKRAIDTAIRHTTGEIILLTDADATPGPLWIQEMVSAFTPAAVMVCGYSPYFPRHTFRQKILALEYFSHAAVAAGGIGAGRPLTCVGSNLAYRREAYLRIGGFEGIAPWISGDDDLLLHKMYQAKIGEISYVAYPETHAPVRPPSSWREFKAQRTRYASKSLHYQPALTLALLLVYLLNLLLCAGLLSAFLGLWKFFIPMLAIGALKATGEYLYLRRAAARFGEEKLLTVFPLAALLHPFYIVFFATRGQLAQFNWRGEQFVAKKISTASEFFNPI
jgi:cellulose synthase/poly-beta-1,6-N-acetylglucosamine synthase-like glycosyltransferase